MLCEAFLVFFLQRRKAKVVKKSSTTEWRINFAPQKVIIVLMMSLVSATDEIVFCYINLSNMLWTKRFDSISFSFIMNNQLQSEKTIRKQTQLVNLLNLVWGSKYANEIKS